MHIRDTLDKRVKRGQESWNFFYMVFAVLLGISSFIVSILSFEWYYKMIILLPLFWFSFWACLKNAWCQNKLIGLKIFLENKWNKI